MCCEFTAAAGQVLKIKLVFTSKLVKTYINTKAGHFLTNPACVRWKKLCYYRTIYRFKEAMQLHLDAQDIHLHDTVESGNIFGVVYMFKKPLLKY